MAVTINQNAGVIQMTEAGDEVTIPLLVKSIRFVAETGQVATDSIQLVDPQATSEILWETFGMAATASEAELIEKMWHNGARLETLTGDRGFVYISYK